jgi:hypothetical protein
MAAANQGKTKGVLFFIRLGKVTLPHFRPARDWEIQQALTFFRARICGECVGVIGKQIILKRKLSHVPIQGVHLISARFNP